MAKCRAIAASDPAVALVLTRITPPRLRVALAHLVDRRLVARSGLHRYIGREAALTPEALTARAVARFRDALQALPGGLPAFLAEGPIGASALRPHRRRSPRHLARGDRRSGHARGGGRDAALLLHDQDQHAAPASAERLQEGAGGLRSRLEAARAGDEARRAGGVRGAPGLRPRPQRAALARRPEGLRGDPRRAPAHAGRARRRRLSRAARARGGAAAADGRVLAEPLPPRVALSPRAGRRVPGHQPPAVAAGVAARPVVGRGLRPGARGAGAAVAVHRRRSQAVDLPVPRRRRDAARRGGLGDPRSCGRTAAGGARSRAASAPGRRCWRSSTTSAPRSPARRRRAPTPSATTPRITSRSTPALPVRPPARPG